MSAPDTVVMLGDFSFMGTEVPANIPYGGEQMIDVKRLQGGGRIIDAMGASDAPLEWSGWFRGPDADPRARYLDSLRRAGNPIELAWGEHLYIVVIRSFRPDYKAFYDVPYSISCEVVEDLTAPITAPPEPSLDDALDGDMGSADDMGGQIGDDSLSGLLGDLEDALGTVTDIFNAGASALNSILDPLTAALGAVGGLIAQAEAIAAGASTLGGVVTGASAAANPASLSLQAANADKLARCYELQAVLTRMVGNLGAAGNSGQVITVGGGTLQDLALRAFGDPNQWTAIAKANNLTDPVITGVVDIRIPPVGDKAGGVLSRA